MSLIDFTKAELAAAAARGVSQFVWIGTRFPMREACESALDQVRQVFAVDEEQPGDSLGAFVETRFESEALAAALEKSHFDRFKATLFVWLGGAGYRSLDAALASLDFIASLPSGSGLLFDYAVDRSSLRSLSQTALDALASSVSIAGRVKYFIQPQAVEAMLRGLGFQQISDVAEEPVALSGLHLVSAVV